MLLSPQVNHVPTTHFHPILEELPRVCPVTSQCLPDMIALRKELYAYTRIVPAASNKFLKFTVLLFSLARYSFRLPARQDDLAVF